MVLFIVAVFPKKVYNRIVKKNIEKYLTNREKSIKYTLQLHTGLIKSGGGNGPMKPGNLLIQGAKSGGNER